MTVACDWIFLNLVFLRFCDLSNDRGWPILGGGKRIISIMDVKSYIRGIERSFSPRAEFNSPKDLRRSRGLVKFMVLDSRQFPGGHMKIERGLSRAYPFPRSGPSPSPPISPLRVSRVRCFPASMPTFSRGNAQTRTILARLRQASCSTGSSRSVLRLAKQWGVLERVANNFRQVGEFVENGKCREEVPYQGDVSWASKGGQKLSGLSYIAHYGESKVQFNARAMEPGQGNWMYFQNYIVQHRHHQSRRYTRVIYIFHLLDSAHD